MTATIIVTQLYIPEQAAFAGTLAVWATAIRTDVATAIRNLAPPLRHSHPWTRRPRPRPPLAAAGTTSSPQASRHSLSRCSPFHYLAVERVPLPPPLAPRMRLTAAILPPVSPSFEHARHGKVVGPARTSAISPKPKRSRWSAAHIVASDFQYVALLVNYRIIVRALGEHTNRGGL